MKRVFSKENLTGSTAVVVYLMIVNFVFHLLTGWQYGFFRDELYYYSMSNHLDYGYVDITPVVPWLMAFSRFALGDSIHAMHVLPALAGSFTMLFAALTARKMGGGRFAQAVTCLAGLAAPVFMTVFGMFIYDAFDQLMSSLVIFMAAKIVKDEAGYKTWILFGFVVGIGVMVKITMGFLVATLLVGLLFTRARRIFANKWLWVSAAIAVTCFIPYVVWQAVHGFPIADYLRSYKAARTIGVTALELLLNVVIAMNPVSVLLWFGGIVLLFQKRGRTFRPFAWAFIAYFALAALTSVRFYALGGVMLPLIAFGAVCLEKGYRREPLPPPDAGGPIPRGERPKKWIPWTLRTAYLVLLCLFGVMALPLTVPLLPVKALAAYNQSADLSRSVKWENTVSSGIPLLMADRLGWEEMAQSVSRIYHALPEDERKDCRIFCVNYGEAGAIDYYSEKYGIPQSISGHLSHYYWGYDGYNGECLIVVGMGPGSYQELKGYFDEVQATPGPHVDFMTAYENDNPIYVCRGLKIPVEDFWKTRRNVG